MVKEEYKLFASIPNDGDNWHKKHVAPEFARLREIHRLINEIISLEGPENKEKVDKLFKELESWM